MGEPPSGRSRALPDYFSNISQPIPDPPPFIGNLGPTLKKVHECPLNEKSIPPVPRARNLMAPRPQRDARYPQRTPSHTVSMPHKKICRNEPNPRCEHFFRPSKRGSHLLCSPKRPSLCGCEPRPEVGRILDAKLSEETLKEMKFNERVAFRRQVLDGSDREISPRSGTVPPADPSYQTGRHGPVSGSGGSLPERNSRWCRLRISEVEQEAPSTVFRLRERGAVPSLNSGFLGHAVSGDAQRR